MGLWGCRAIIIFLLTFVLVRSQILRQTCIRQDKTRGVCRDIRECVDQNGHLESATNLQLCAGSEINRIIACCRKTPAIIARQKCEEWKRQARADGSVCEVNIPLARGGTEATIGEFPHMVSLLRLSSDGRLSHICGGVLISNQYILTAAHCIDNSRIIAQIGGHDVRFPEQEVTVEAEVADRILHPQYKRPRGYNDIALLKLRIAVSFSRRVRPACLPYQSTRLQPNTKLVVAGWGAYENAGPSSNVLRKAEVTVLERFDCDSNPVIASTSTTYPAGITDSIICGDESEQGACRGDSGGPLMEVTTSTCEVKEVIGLVSRGIPECRRNDVPGTYTRLHYYLDWIVRTVWPEEL